MEINSTRVISFVTAFRLEIDAICIKTHHFSSNMLIISEIRSKMRYSMSKVPRSIGDQPLNGDQLEAPRRSRWKTVLSDR